MTTTYRLHVSELSADLISSIRAGFKGKVVEIVVSDEVDKTDTDTIRKYTADEDSFKFWIAEEDLYQDYHKQNLE